MTSAAAASRSARKTPSAAMPVMTCVPLMSASPSFGAELDRSQSGALERDVAWQPLAVKERLALADQHERHVRERGEIAARADRALARHDRRDAAVEHRHDRVERLRLDAGVAGRERVRAQHAGSAHDRNRERLAGSRRVAAHQVELQLDGLRGIDRNVGQPPKAGRDAVNRLAAREPRVDELTRAHDAGAGRRGNLDRSALRDRLEGLEREVVAVELDGHKLAQSGCGVGANGGPF